MNARHFTNETIRRMRAELLTFIAEHTDMPEGHRQELAEAQDQQKYLAGELERRARPKTMPRIYVDDGEAYSQMGQACDKVIADSLKQVFTYTLADLAAQLQHDVSGGQKWTDLYRLVMAEGQRRRGETGFDALMTAAEAKQPETGLDQLFE